MNKNQRAEQFRRALQMFAAALTDEQKQEVATIFSAYVVGRAYSAGDNFVYGEDGVGDPQLYVVNQAHVSQADWPPDRTPALYKAIGIDPAGYPLWSQPAGAHDAYAAGDIVDLDGTLYISTVDGNVWRPGVYGWDIYQE